MVLSTLGHAGAALSHAHAAAIGGMGKGTHTSLDISAGTLGEPITFTVSVVAPKAAGAPAGTVTLSDRGDVLHTLTLAPVQSKNPKVAVSQATLTEIAQAGGPAFYFGKHTVTATYTPGNGLAPSSTSRSFKVSTPRYTTLDGGVKYATVVQGFGATLQTGQTANVFYTGYLAKTGQIFDDTVSHGGMPLTFVLGSRQLIPGFEAGVAGMKVGETRIIEIPPSQGYGSTANGAIPANSTLVFEVTLESVA